VKRLMIFVTTVTLLLPFGIILAEDPAFKPFVLASVSDAGVEEVTGRTIRALESAGFRIAGRYDPLEDTRIIVATSDELLGIAAGSERGGYAAAQRISITQNDGQVEVAFVNPQYIQHAYRLESDMGGVLSRLREVLGFERYCGAGDKSMTARKLRKYNYMMGMQKFDDPSELGSFESHEAAVAAVEAGLAKEGDGLEKIYRIDIPGTEQTLFGVGMQAVSEDTEHIDEAAQMRVVDFEGCRKRAYLPYEVLVNGPRVEALHMRFRMAVHFPNLSMMGEHGFTKLIPFPGAIETALEDMLRDQ